MSIGEEFLSYDTQPVSSWRLLLGVLSSLTPLVPGGRRRMRSLQILLHRSWDQVDDSFLVRWDDSCRQDLCWWLDLTSLGEGVSVSQVSGVPEPRLLVRHL